MPQWVRACATDEMDAEDLVHFDHSGSTNAIYYARDSKFYSIAGLCSHEDEHISNGLMTGPLIECPKPYGQFDYNNRAAKRVPVCVNREIFPVKIVDLAIFHEVQCGRRN